MPHYLIAPSLLSANFARLGEEATKVLNAGADLLHFDVMDNHFVPNLTIGPLVCASLRKEGITAPIDVHLMARPVDNLITEFAKAGATSITIHPEGSDDLDHSLKLIRESGCKAGLAFSPATTLQSLEYTLNKLDLILIMSVNPGFAGQAFIETSLEKIKQARTLIDKSGYNIRLGIDGGINLKTIYSAVQAGANTFIAGSAIFGQPDYSKVINAMREELNKCIKDHR
jgi:ribulose-phosphate 3-epimerase